MDENNQNIVNCWNLDVYYTVKARSVIIGSAKFIKHNNCNLKESNVNRVSFLS